MGVDGPLGHARGTPRSPCWSGPWRPARRPRARAASAAASGPRTRRPPGPLPAPAAQRRAVLPDDRGQPVPPVPSVSAARSTIDLSTSPTRVSRISSWRPSSSPAHASSAAARSKPSARTVSLVHSSRSAGEHRWKLQLMDACSDRWRSPAPVRPCPSSRRWPGSLASSSSRPTARSRSAASSIASGMPSSTGRAARPWAACPRSPRIRGPPPRPGRRTG